MTKKEYKKPAIQIGHLENVDIICTSDTSTFNAKRDISRGSDDDWDEELDW